jgi:hypothetical protein
MVSTSDALIAISDSILNSINELNKLEYNKKGRKYRFVNNTFQRIREEDKHLVICPEDLLQKLSIISSFYILYNINNGEIFDKYPDFCLSIIGVAHKLEVETWYEEENSSVIHLKNAKYNPLPIKDMALDFVLNNPIQPRHIEMGLNMLICSKLNFLHTDHHIGTKVEGHYMKHFIIEYFGEELLSSPDILVALKSFVHWGNIKGILYKLDVPHVNIDDKLANSFVSFPEPMEELKLSVYDRYPSGTSKYSLIRKSIDILGDWQYSQLIPYPQIESGESDDDFNLQWLYELCHDIEHDPIKYHLRSASKGLCTEPVNLTELSSQHHNLIKSLLNLISIIINLFDETGGEFLLQNSKIPKLTNELIAKYHDYYDKLEKIQQSITGYEAKGWSPEDIVIRLKTANGEASLFDKVMEMREKYIDDYE